MAPKQALIVWTAGLFFAIPLACLVYTLAAPGSSVHDFVELVAAPYFYAGIGIYVVLGGIGWSILHLLNRVAYGPKDRKTRNDSSPPRPN